MTPNEEKGKEFLMHYGVLGMRWGHRKDRSSNGRTVKAKRSKKKATVEEMQAAIKKDGLQKQYNKLQNKRLSSIQNMTNKSAEIVRQTNRILKDSDPKPYRKNLDLSKMTNKELQDQITRANLERQYQSLFAPEVRPTISKGRKRVEQTLSATGDLLAIGSSALGIALAIKELKG